MAGSLYNRGGQLILSKQSKKELFYASQIIELNIPIEIKEKYLRNHGIFPQKGANGMVRKFINNFKNSPQLENLLNNTIGHKVDSERVLEIEEYRESASHKSRITKG